ncbi:tetratricopeptide repeat protein 4 isoform X1 [Callorhinchus milii]|uniref:tetratricopeptide repeat protein 4 isoform X1 n=2 Tax=Callorhinchus milii TaxID=7868 RepID=UPI001C3FC2B4|nr:tetratricopeptide repeat protein 4 isoform X1 [Callorhinchus milii]
MDAFMDQFKHQRYRAGFNEDNWEEEFDNIPMFMKKAPEEIDPVKTPELACIQTILYDEDQSPEDLAKTYKDEGNHYFGEKNYKKAIISYTEGLKKKCSDPNLNTVLYTNRAAAHFHLGNNRSALNDAIEARKLKPDHLKAIIRGVLCHTELKDYSKAIMWCNEGLQVNPKEKQLVDLRSRADKQKRVEERNARKAKLKEKKEHLQKEALLKAIEERKIKLFRSQECFSRHSDEEEEERVSKNLMDLSFDGTDAESATGARVYLDENGNLQWPVLFLYPEYGQTDFISAFNEDTRFIDHLSVMFDKDLPPWDVEKKYQADRLELYFEDEEREDLFRVNPDCTLRQVLSHPRYFVKAGSPKFIILVRGSSYSLEFLSGKKLQQAS